MRTNSSDSVYASHTLPLDDWSFIIYLVDDLNWYK